MNTRRRAKKTLKATLMIVMAACILLLWSYESLATTLIKVARDKLTFQVLITILCGVAIALLAIPRSIDIIRRYFSSIKRDVEDVVTQYREWAKEMEFITLSKESLRRQKEALEGKVEG